VAGSLEVVSAVCEQVWAAGGLCTTVANFPAFERGLQAGLAGRVTKLDTVPYRELELELEGRKVFHQLDRLGSIQYLQLSQQ